MEISKYGFEVVGIWKKSETVNSGVTFILYQYSAERVIYSFVVKDTPKYIGICEKNTTTLQDRMNRYKNQQGAGTNERVSNLIRNELELGNKVDIYALKISQEILYKDISIDLIKGLENPLIVLFKPEWNIRQ